MELVGTEAYQVAMEELKTEAYRYTKLLQHSSDFVLVAQSAPPDDMHHLYASPSCNRVTGYTSEWWMNTSLKGMIKDGVIHPEDGTTGSELTNMAVEWVSGSSKTSHRAHLRFKHGVTCEWRNFELRADEVPKTNKVVVVPVEGVLNVAVQDTCQCVIVMRDITDRVTRQKLEVENARLETAREKDLRHQAFLSHEIKNRLLATRGLATNCRQTVIEHASKLMVTPYNFSESMDNLIGQVDRGVRLCTNEGVMRGIIWGTYKATEEVIHVKSLLQQCCPPGVRLNVAPGLSHCRVDPQLLNHILDNLVANAVRYGGKNLPGVKGIYPIKIDAHVNRSSMLVFSVTNAPGSKHEEMCVKYGEDSSPLFEHGQKGIDAERNSVSQGQGLSIAKMCADAMGGELTLSFEKSLVISKLKVAYHCVNMHTTPILPDDLVIASLDDDDVARMVDKTMFTEMNINESSVNNVFGETEEDIVNFEQIFWTLDPLPSILILDHHLDHPQFRTKLRLGTDIVKTLRSNGYTGKIVMRSANDSSVDVARFLEAGADAVFRKGMTMQSTILRIAPLCGIPTDLDATQQVLKSRESETSPFTSLVGSPNTSTHGGTVIQTMMASETSALGMLSPRLTRRSLPPTKMKPMRCLGVDDDPFIATTLMGVFSNLGASVADVIGTSTVEQNAVEAIVMGRQSLTLASTHEIDKAGSDACSWNLDRNSSQRNAAYDLVILDNNLDDPDTGFPHRDGCEIAKNLRNEGFNGILILHTALFGHELIEVQRHTFLDAVVEKGKSMDAVLKTIIQLRLTLDTIAQVSEPHRVRRDTLERLPRAIRNEHLGILFGTTTQGLHAQVATIEAGDEALQQRLLHRLKGVAASFGLECLEVLFQSARNASSETRSFLAIRREIDDVATILRLEGYI